MPDLKIKIMTEADLKASEAARAEFQRFRRETDQTTEALKKNAALNVDVGDKLQKNLVKGVLAGTLAFKGLNTAITVAAQAFKPVNEAFDQLTTSLGNLAGRGSEFLPIKGLTELFRTAAEWVDVIGLKLDSINTKAKTHGELWRDAGRAAAEVAHIAGEQEDEEKFINTQLEARLKLIERAEGVAQTQFDKDKAIASAKANAIQDPLVKAKAIAQVESTFGQRQAALTEDFRGRRAGAVASARDQLFALGAADQAALPTAEQFLPILKEFQGVDALSTAARGRFNRAMAILTGGATGTERTLAERNAAEASADVKFLRPKLDALRSQLPAGVTDEAGLQGYIEQQQAAFATRGVRRGLLSESLAQRQADLTYQFHNAGISAAGAQQAGGIASAANIAAAQEQSQARQTQLARQLLDGLSGSNQAQERYMQEVIRLLQKQETTAKTNTARVAAQANAQN